MTQSTDLGSTSDLSYVRKVMLERLGQSDAFFRSQQRQDEDLTAPEKRAIAEQVLDRSLPLFLQRFHQHLTLADLAYFEPHRDNYEVHFYLQEIGKRLDAKTGSVQIKNRRYDALQQLIAGGVYFRDPEMRRRNPFLYEQMIGKFLTDTERELLEDKPESATFSGFLIRSIEKSREEGLRREQEAAERLDDLDIDSEDERGSEEEESELESDQEIEGPFPRGPVPISAQEKDLLRKEFTNLMYEQFLAGKDDNFDYSAVDENADYDSLKMKEEEEQEKYFDS